MPLTFNTQPLAFFKETNFRNENAILQLDSNKKVTSNSNFHSANIFRWMRGSEARRNNNEIRTQLLKSLGESFGLSGIETNDHGETTFSKDFMDKLENLLGPAFKREDFGVPAEGGAVSSGKPLTARRLNAIYASATMFDTSKFDLQEYKQKIGNILKTQFGLETTLNLSYEDLERFAVQNPALRVYAGIEKCIDFLQNTFNGFIRESKDLIDAKKMNFSQEDLNEIPVKFEIKDLKTGEYKDLSTQQYTFMLTQALGNNLVHTERSNFRVAKSTDVTPLNKYIENTVKAYIKTGIDAFFEARLNGKINELFHHLESPGACTEEKTARLREFREKHFQGQVDTKLESELNTIINNTNQRPLNKTIEDELGFITNGDSKKNPKFRTWDQFSEELKKRLVNTTRPMVEIKKNNGQIEFVPKLDKHGFVEVRPIRESDIDTVGKAVYEQIFGADE